MQLYFYGASGFVTGSCFLLEHNNKKILIDCGLVQGENFAEDVNFGDFPFDPKEIDAVFVTHAHIDHTGRLPKLAGEGFEGPVYSLAPTKDFSEFLLKDSIDILSREADRCNADTFCSGQNIGKLMKKWKTVDYGKSITHGPFTVNFYNAGHILGSSFIEVEAGGKRVVFSGDLGNSPAPLLPSRQNLDVLGDAPDYVVMESTYGDQVHEPPEKVEKKLDDVITDVSRAGGVLMIPAFAMERTQDLLFHIHRLMDQGEIPKTPVYLDSPLAIKLTDVYEKYSKWLNKETKQFKSENRKLFKFPELTETLSSKESKSINSAPEPKIIIAGAGMSTGGRILHHERRYLSDPKNALLIVGFQVEGSLGRKILEGSKTGAPFKVEIFGDEIPVRCRVDAIGGYSAHADRPQLLDWLGSAAGDLDKAFLVHGEPDQSEALVKTLDEEFGLEAEIPEYESNVEL